MYPFDFPHEVSALIEKDGTDDSNKEPKEETTNAQKWVYVSLELLWIYSI